MRDECLMAVVFGCTAPLLEKILTYSLPCEYESVLDLSRKICNALELTYLYDLDVVLDTEEKAQLIEVNPRLSGGAAATVTAGINLFEYLVHVALGIRVPELDIPYGRVVKSVMQTMVVKV